MFKGQHSPALTDRNATVVIHSRLSFICSSLHSVSNLHSSVILPMPCCFKYFKSKTHFLVCADIHTYIILSKKYL